MINKDTVVKVVNKYKSVVGYTIPELNIHRNFYPRESKDITFEELERLSFVPGGDVILKEYLEITDENVVMELFGNHSEPEYHYSEEDIKKLLTTGSMDQFLDCLDYAPSVVKDMIKNLAVEMPLNDVEKRNAIKEKMGFDVAKAIEVKNTKYDGENEDGEQKEEAPKRRVAVAKPAVATGRRVQSSEDKK